MMSIFIDIIEMSSVFMVITRQTGIGIWDSWRRNISKRMTKLTPGMVRRQQQAQWKLVIQRNTDDADDTTGDGIAHIPHESWTNIIYNQCAIHCLETENKICTLFHVWPTVTLLHTGNNYFVNVFNCCLSYVIVCIYCHCDYVLIWSTSSYNTWNCSILPYRYSLHHIYYTSIIENKMQWFYNTFDQIIIFDICLVW